MLEFSGTNRVEQLINGLKELNGETSVPIEELFPSSFMEDCSRFSSISDFFSKSPFKLVVSDDLEAIPRNDLDLYVSENTKYRSWDEMKTEAGRQYILQKLGF